MINIKSLFKIMSLSLLLSLPVSASSTNTEESLQLKGEIKQGGLLIGKAQPGSEVWLNDRAITVSQNGDFVFGFGRDESKAHTLLVKTPSGETLTKEITPQVREYDIQRINGIKKSIMKPNSEALKRVRKDNAIIAQARKTNSPLLAFSKPFIAPMEGRVTGVYGSQRVFNGEPKRPHFGLDYAGKTGDPIKSPADGTVLVYEPDMFYSGGTMIIDHGHGITSTFLHLSASHVKVGESVKQGQVIAAVGASGRATGPHLDWRINWFNVRIDPALVLSIKH